MLDLWNPARTAAHEENLSIAVVLPAISILVLAAVIVLVMRWIAARRAVAWAHKSSAADTAHSPEDTLARFQHQATNGEQHQPHEPAQDVRLMVAAASTLALDEILQQVYEQVRRFFSLDVLCVALCSPGGDVAQTELLVQEGHTQQPGGVIELDADSSPAGRVIRSRQPLRIGDLQADTDSSVEMSQAPAKVRAWLGVPLIAQEKVIGMMSVQSYRPNAFAANDEHRLASLATQAAAAIENAWLYREAKRRLEEASIIQTLALAGASGQPLDDIVAEATERLRRLWDSHNLGFLFPDGRGALQVHNSYLGLSPQNKQKGRIQLGTGITGAVFQTGQPIIVPDVRQDARYLESTPETRSEMAAPLVVGDRVIGVLNVESTRLNAFTAEDVRLLSALAGQLAIILDNAQAHRDLAERAEELQQAYDELAEAERLKDQLVQNISHELRTPVTYIKGYTDLMLTEALGPLPAGLRDFLQIVSRKTETVSHLIERIVTLQTVSPLALQLEPLRLNNLIQELTDLWKPRVQQAGLEMTVHVDGELTLIAGDRKQLLEALGNLLGNAIKFSPKGGRLTVTAKVEAEAVHIQVADTGIGIPPDKLARVFDRFYQIDGTTRRRFGGAGVGLALVRRIIEAHGGRAWAESKGPGYGSEFHMILPIAPIPA